jgi:hypothetical protein
MLFTGIYLNCLGLPAQPHMAALQQLLEALRTARTSREVSSIVLLIGKAVESLLEGLVPGLQVEAEMLARFRDANLLVLKVRLFFISGCYGQ